MQRTGDTEKEPQPTPGLGPLPSCAWPQVATRPAQQAARGTADTGTTRQSLVSGKYPLSSEIQNDSSDTSNTIWVITRQDKYSCRFLRQVDITLARWPCKSHVNVLKFPYP